MRQRAKPVFRDQAGTRQDAKSKAFFFEKKKQKTFEICVRRMVYPAGLGFVPKEQKFFGSFFQKRTAFFLHAASDLNLFDLAFFFGEGLVDALDVAIRQFLHLV